jgi:hypothetical protein
VAATCAHPEQLRGQLVTRIAAELFTCEDSPKPFLLVEPKTQIALRGRDLTLSCRWVDLGIFAFKVKSEFELIDFFRIQKCFYNCKIYT